MSPTSPRAAPAAALGRSLHALWSGQAAPRGPDGRLQPWDVVIVGTGYGGSAAAAALAGCTVADDQGRRRPLRLCILERGQELRPGDFPSRLAELPGHLRIGQQATGEVGGQAEGLFDVRVGDDVMALVANGVGGGSLISRRHFFFFFFFLRSRRRSRRRRSKERLQATRRTRWTTY